MDLELSNPQINEKQAISTPAKSVVYKPKQSTDSFISRFKAPAIPERNDFIENITKAQAESNLKIEQFRLEEERRRRSLGGGGGSSSFKGSSKKANFGNSESFFYSLFTQNFNIDKVKQFTLSTVLNNIFSDVVSVHNGAIENPAEVKNPLTIQVKKVQKMLNKIASNVRGFFAKASKRLIDSLSSPANSLLSKIVDILFSMNGIGSNLIKKAKSIRSSSSNNLSEINERMSELKENIFRHKDIDQKQDDTEQENTVIKSLKNRIKLIIDMLY